MWWAVWCAAVVAGAGAGAAAAPSPDALAPLDILQIDPPAPDDESMNYAERYGSGAPWVYLLAEMPRESQVASSEAMRTRRSFTVNPAVDVLQRTAYNSYMERLAHNNRNFLDRVGKRGGRAGEAAHALAVDRPADVGAAPEADPGEGEEGPGAQGPGQQELLERHRQERFAVGPFIRR